MLTSDNKSGEIILSLSVGSGDINEKASSCSDARAGLFHFPGMVHIQEFSGQSNMDFDGEFTPSRTWSSMAGEGRSSLMNMCISGYEAEKR